MAAFRDSFREQADKQVKLRLALEKIAADEKITPTEDDIEEEYKKLAESYGTELDNVKSAIPSTELVKDISVRKAFDFIRDNADITEVDAPTEKKPVAKKATAKKPAAKKASADKADEGEKKPAAKKTAADKAGDGEKKTTAKKTTAAKKPAAKKTAAKKEDSAE